ncbi:MAG: hypothetical protein EZS28_006363 [Streblomastix strix]|uniref:DDE-1 domain-containing protein n=1 Tax=Streblomastix strix TaxID=222440 RepID=A0A5J4WT42_9EUKA|nr:MAG: hypothetical protein EZS28_006363 [Streblomastix strix]
MRSFTSDIGRKETFQVEEIIGRSFVDSFIRRHDDLVDQKWCHSGEHGRIEVKREDDWPDAKPQLKLVPAKITAGQLKYKVKRNEHLHTVISAITLFGDTLPPLVVIKRLTLDYEVHSTGLCEGEDVVIVHGPKKYVNGRLQAQEEAILLMDNLSAHKTGEELEKLRDVNVWPIVLRKANNISAANTQAEIIQRVVTAAEEATTPTRNRFAIKSI